MSTNNTIQGVSRTLKVQRLLSVLLIAIGAVLMTLKIYADSEPGAIPLALVIVGVGWYLVTRARIRSHRR